MDKKNLFEVFRKVHPITYEEFKPVEKILRIEYYKKGDFILEKNQIDNTLKFVLSGVIHQYYIVENTIFTKNLAISGMYFNNFQSYDGNIPSKETQEALTDVKIISMQKNDVEKLLRINHSFCFIYTKTLQHFYSQREKRTLILQQKNAYERFELFMNTIDNSYKYLQEIPQMKIADYLGMNPETLSRAKKKYFKQSQLISS